MKGGFGIGGIVKRRLAMESDWGEESKCCAKPARGCGGREIEAINAVCSIKEFEQENGKEEANQE